MEDCKEADPAPPPTDPPASPLAADALAADASPAAPRPFFDCKEDLVATSREVFIAEQLSADSKEMRAIRARIGQGFRKGISFTQSDDGLIMMKGEWLFQKACTSEFSQPTTTRSYQATKAGNER